MSLPTWVSRADAMKLLGLESETVFARLVREYKIPNHRGGKNASLFERSKLLVVVRKRAEKAAKVEQDKLQAEAVAKIQAKAKVLGVELQKATMPTVSNIVGAGQITARAFKIFEAQLSSGQRDLAAVAIELEITGEEVIDLFTTWWDLKKRSQEWTQGPQPQPAAQAFAPPQPDPLPLVPPAPTGGPPYPFPVRHGTLVGPPVTATAANDGQTSAQRDYLARWTKQQEEWRAIAEELAQKNGEGVTPHQVTTEQRKRALARGEKLLDEADLKAIGG